MVSLSCNQVKNNSEPRLWFLLNSESSMQTFQVSLNRSLPSFFIRVWQCFYLLVAFPFLREALLSTFEPQQSDVELCFSAVFSFCFVQMLDPLALVLIKVRLQISCCYCFRPAGMKAFVASLSVFIHLLNLWHFNCGSIYLDLLLNCACRIFDRRLWKI